MATNAASRKIKLYGVPLSQPFRAAAWTLLQRHVPFDVVVTAPGTDATKPFSTRHVSFVNKTKGKTSTIPVMEEISTSADGSNHSFCISESPAILSYLCESRGWVGETELYALPGTRRKALIDSYMHWHHNGTRNLLSMTVPFLRPDIDVTEQQVQQAKDTLSNLEEGWLSGSGNGVMIGGTPAASIADILCYEEIAQSTMTGLFPMESFKESFPNLNAWLQRMQELPYHAEAHAALTSLGLLVLPDGITPVDEPANMRKRLATATKAGLTAYQTVQKSYDAGHSKL